MLRAQKGELAWESQGPGAGLGPRQLVVPQAICPSFPSEQQSPLSLYRRRATTYGDAPCLPHSNLRPCDQRPANGEGPKAHVWGPGERAMHPLSSLISAWLHRGSAVAGLSFPTYRGEGTRKATDGQWRQPAPQTPGGTT